MELHKQINSLKIAQPHPFSWAHGIITAWRTAQPGPTNECYQQAKIHRGRCGPPQSARCHELLVTALPTMTRWGRLISTEHNQGMWLTSMDCSTITLWDLTHDQLEISMRPMTHREFPQECRNTNWRSTQYIWVNGHRILNYADYNFLSPQVNLFVEVKSCREFWPMELATAGPQ
jgi:hypothetical protein